MTKNIWCPLHGLWPDTDLVAVEHLQEITTWGSNGDVTDVPEMSMS